MAELSERMADAGKKGMAALERDGIPYLLGGGLGCWALGGPQSTKDVDLFVRPEDAEAALEAMAKAGMRTEHPPEQWLVKAYDGDVLIDIIFGPAGLAVDDELLARAVITGFHGMDARVMHLDDIMVTKLMALDEHALDLAPLLQIARSLREQIGWEDIRSRTGHYPYAKPFFALVDELGISPAAETEAGAQAGA